MDKSNNQDCSTCSVDCDESETAPVDFSEKCHELSNIKKVIGVVSGKGGVGKSLVTSMLASLMNSRGHSTAVLDADITGPSIPKIFGITKKANANNLGWFPVKSEKGINIMSVNLLVENDTDPVVWRGPVIAGAVKQFWTDVIWGDIDFMFIDMPPGTGDVPLTVFQSIPIDGIVIVTSPQELVSMIVSKAVKMAELMNIPIIGLVENMSYLKCPSCNDEIKVFGDSHIEEISDKYNINILGKIPIDPEIALACDKGKIESLQAGYIDGIAEVLESIGGIKMKIAVASDGKMITNHFGHCESFNIFEIKSNEIVKSEVIPNPGHKPGFLPNFLNDIGINIIISGGMGKGAVDIFNEKNIEVIVGVSGSAESAVDSYLKGTLKSTGSVCEEHQHKDECGN